MKQQIYENILPRQSVMDYGPGILFQSILVNMDKVKALTKKNQLVKTNQKKGIQCRCGSIKHLRITSNDFPVGISYQKEKIGLGNGNIYS